MRRMRRRIIVMRIEITALFVEVFLNWLNFELEFFIANC